MCSSYFVITDVFFLGVYRQCFYGRFRVTVQELIEFMKSWDTFQAFSEVYPDSDIISTLEQKYVFTQIATT